MVLVRVHTCHHVHVEIGGLVSRVSSLFHLYMGFVD